MRDRRLVGSHADLQRRGGIADHLVGREVHAPGPEQPRQAGSGLRRTLLQHRVAGGPAGFAVRIDVDDRLAALEHELVDRVLHAVGEARRMHHHQRGDVLVDGIAREREVAHLEALLQLLHHHPGRCRLRAHHVEAAVDLQPGYHADHRLLRRDQAREHLAELVLEELLALGLEERDHLVLAPGIAAGEPEIHLLAAGIERHRLQAELRGLVLGFGEGHRIDHLQPDAPVGAQRVLLEQLAHAPRVAAQRRHVARRLVGEEEVEIDRLLDAVDDLARARGNRVHAVLREVDAQPAEQQVVQRHETHEAERQQRQRQARVDPAVHRHALNPPASFRSPPRSPPATPRPAPRRTAGPAARSRPC